MPKSTNGVYVTLIGSFHQDKAKLKSIYEILGKNYTVLSPKSIDFTNRADAFVKTNRESGRSIYDIETTHLDAIKQSDFIVLHAPDGYVGASGALEIGYAYSLGIPILADEQPADKTLASLIIGLLTESEKTVSTRFKPGKGLDTLQNYYRRIAKQRGWNNESARDTLLLMLEEMGELARAIRKQEGLKRDGEYTLSVAEELADVQLYLVHLSNSLGITLSNAVTEKEIKNTKRFHDRTPN